MFCRLIYRFKEIDFADLIREQEFCADSSPLFISTAKKAASLAELQWRFVVFWQAFSILCELIFAILVVLIIFAFY